MSSLLHDVLNRQEGDQLSQRLQATNLDSLATAIASSEQAFPSLKTPRTLSPTSDDDDLVTVKSLAVSPRSFSRTTSRNNSRPTSPTRLGAAGRRPPGPLLLSPSKSRAKDSTPATDPIRVLPSEICQRIFSTLSIHQLARCARVSRKWSKSQSLNYVWFQHYRKEHFHDESLTPGKWTRRESRQNWRTTYLDLRRKAMADGGGDFFQRTGFSTPTYGSGGGGSGYQTPREIKEDRWRQEADDTRPGKLEMREMYKELGGRKSKTKSKYQTGSSARDRGGWAGDPAELEN